MELGGFLVSMKQKKEVQNGKKAGKKSLLKSRKFKYGGFVTLFTVIFLVAVVILNVIATALVDRYPLTLDLTSTDAYELSADSSGYVQGLDKKIQIDVLTDKQSLRSAGSYFVQVDEIINQYAKLNSNITVNYIDIVKNPAYASNYPNQDVSEYDIVVSCGQDRVKVVSIADMFNMDTSSGSIAITSSKAEKVMTSAIMSVASDENYKVAIMTGHEELSSSGFQSFLSENVYDVSTLNLATDEIPEDTNLVVIVAPMRDYSEDELKKIDRFLDNNGKFGKNVMYVADTSQPESLPNLDAFLAEWGIKVNPGAVYETDSSKVFNYQRYFVITDYAEDTYSADFKSANRLVALPSSRPLEVLFETGNSRRTTTLLQFSATAGVAPADAGVDFDFDGNVTGSPFPGVELSTQTTYDGTTQQNSNVIVAGSTSFISSDLISSTSIANGEYLINLLNTLTERKNVVDIVSKELGGTALSMTQNQTTTLAVTFIAIVPLIVLICGVVIWLRRRNR